MEIFDWIFIITGFIFFTLMIIAFILMSMNKMKILRNLGFAFAFLLLPLTATLINYIIIGMNFRFFIFIPLIMSYLIVEILLDLILKFDFRSKLSTHIPYIILEYAACFSFVYGVLALDRTIG